LLEQRHGAIAVLHIGRVDEQLERAPVGSRLAELSHYSRPPTVTAERKRGSATVDGRLPKVCCRAGRDSLLSLMFDQTNKGALAGHIASDELALATIFRLLPVGFRNALRPEDPRGRAHNYWTSARRPWRLRGNRSGGGGRYRQGRTKE